MEVLKELHTSVAQQFENIFDNAYKNLNAELALRDAQLKEAKERAKTAEEAQNSTAAEVAELRHEIAHLREEIRRNDVGSEEVEASAANFLQLEETYAPEHVLGLIDRTTSEVRTVFNQYTALYGEVQTLINASGELRKQVKRHKRKLKYWRNSLDLEEFTLVLDGVSVEFQRVRRTANANTEQAATAESTPSAIELAGQDVTSGDSTPTPRLPRPNLNDNRPTPKASFENDSVNNHDQRQDSQLLDLPSTDLPSEILPGPGTRTLKRKSVMMSDPPSVYPHYQGNLNNGSPEKPILIKSETMSSSPLGNFSQYRGPIGTQDLDEIGSTVETPTKRKTYKFDRNNQRAPSVTLEPASTHNLALQRDNCERLASTPKTSKRSTVLQPVNGNLRAVDWSGRRSDQKPTRNSEKKSRISLIAEDGDESYSSPCIQRGQQKMTPGVRLTQSGTDNTPTQQRLQGLLEGPLPPRHPLQLQRKIGSVENSSPRASSITGKQASSPKSDSHALTNHITNPGPQAIQQPNMQRDLGKARGILEVHPEDEPYRARPLHRLDLSHFKINPDNNQGLDFAFDTVVRRKDERRCVNGCTRQDCCGDKFLAMARLGAPVNLDASCQEEEDQKILEDYLGDEKHLLAELNAEERQNLLHEARARLMANHYGKHRHTHQRPRTPPGFWRTDMPDTQELDHDREEARKLQRAKVKERYREAMRPGGIWKFADE